LIFSGQNDFLIQKKVGKKFPLDFGLGGFFIK